MSVAAKYISGNELEVELAEIDENLTDAGLTRAEEARHLARHEEIMAALGERALASPGTNQHTPPVPATVAGTSPKTTADLAKERGMSDANFDPATVAGSKERTTADLAKERGMSDRTGREPHTEGLRWR